MSAYNLDLFIGAVIYYLAKNEIHQCSFEKLYNIHKNFLKYSGDERTFISLSRGDVYDFCKSQAYVAYDKVYEIVYISVDYDVRVMCSFKKYAKIFKNLDTWKALKKAVRKEFNIKWLFISERNHDSGFFFVDKELDAVVKLDL